MSMNFRSVDTYIYILNVKYTISVSCLHKHYQHLLTSRHTTHITLLFSKRRLRRVRSESFTISPHSWF